MAGKLLVEVVAAGMVVVDRLLVAELVGDNMALDISSCSGEYRLVDTEVEEEQRHQDIQVLLVDPLVPSVP